MKKRILILSLTALFLSACTAIGLGGPTSTPTPNATLTLEARSAISTQAAIAAEQTQEVLAQTATKEAKDLNRTATSQAYSTQRASRLGTSQARSTATAAERTAVAQPMMEKIGELVGQGYLSTDKGVLRQLDNFTRSWAQLNWFRWWTVGYSPSDFVISTHIKWESASETADWWSSGCGFVFREDIEEGNFYYASLRLNGYVRVWGEVKGFRRDLGSAYFGKADVPNGEADFMLAVEDTQFHVFVNGQHVHTARDSALKFGELNYTLGSGTNKDWGTRCTFLDVWLFEPRQ